MVYLEDGSALYQLKELVDRVLQTERALNYFRREGRKEHVHFVLLWEPPVDSLGRSLYMRKLEPKVLRKIESIRIEGPFKVEVGTFDMQHGRLGRVSVSLGGATIGGRDAMAVATVGEA